MLSGFRAGVERGRSTEGSDSTDSTDSTDGSPADTQTT
jgi:hypothetical protein